MGINCKLFCLLFASKENMIDEGVWSYLAKVKMVLKKDKKKKDDKNATHA